jgi:hypothetical protein
VGSILPRAALAAALLTLGGAAQASAMSFGLQRQLSRGNDSQSAEGVAMAGNPRGVQLVVWGEGPSPPASPDNEVYARSVLSGGRPRGPVVRVSQMGPEGVPGYQAANPAVAFNSRRREFLAAWSGNGTSEARRACPAPPPGPFPVPPHLGGDCYETDEEIYVRVLDRVGRPRGPQRRITSIGPDDRVEYPAYLSSLIYNRTANEYLVVFSAVVADNRAREVFVQRLDSRGQEIGADDRRLTNRTPGLFPGGGSQPVADGRAVWDPSSKRYLLVYSFNPGGEEDKLYSLLLSARGKPLRADRSLRQRGASVALALNRKAGGVLAVWAGGFREPVVVRKLDVRGRPVSRPTVVLRGRELSHGHAVAPAGRGFLVVWSRETDVGGPFTDTEIYGIRVDRAGRPVGSPFRISRMGPEPGRYSQTTFHAFWPALAPLASRRGFLVAWSGLDRDDQGSFEAYARRVRP